MLGELEAGIQEEIKLQGLDLIGVIPQDPMVYEYDSAGKPTASLPEDSLSKKAVKEIMSKLDI